MLLRASNYTGRAQKSEQTAVWSSVEVRTSFAGRPTSPDQEHRGDPWNEVGRSRMKVWWQCSADPAHVWQTQICSRIRKNSGCPMCANKVRVPEGKDSFAGRFPVRQASASEFHPTKNAPHTPDRLHPHSHKRMWWQCAADPDHTWQVAIDSRARDPKPQCPF
eukprot:786727_1